MVGSDSKGHVVAAAAIGVLVVAGAIAAALVFFFNDDDDSRTPDPVAEAYLDAWEDDDLDAMIGLTEDAPDGAFTEAYETFTEALRVTDAAFELVDVETDGDDAIADFEVTLDVQGFGEWAYDGSLRLRRTGEDGSWLVDWSPAAIHPRQRDGYLLTLNRQWPDRGTITDADGEPLISEQPAVLVGVNQQRMDDVQDRSQLHEAFEEHLDISPDAVDAALDAPGVEEDHLVEMTTLTEDRFRQVDSDLRPVPGIVFDDERALRTGPSEDFAAHVIGRTGEITAEQLDDLGSPYETGDIVGVTGLERRFERELAGTPDGEIRLENGNGEDEAETGGVLDEEDDEEDPVVHTFEGVDPVDIPTTLDVSVQLALDAALDAVDHEAGAVVLDREGNIRAASSRPLDDGFNRAIEGNYPPGSTFKVVTTDALLAGGLAPDDEVDCSETIVAGGRELTNFEDAELGNVPFRTAFAESCNTAFISAAAGVPGPDLVAAAERFGFNTEYTIGLTTAEPSFPEPADEAEHGAAAIGQGRTLASPLHMATVASAVATGTWQPPTLLPELDDPDGTSAPAPQNLDSGAGETITELMQLVVTEGSGDAAAVPGGTVAGKTGTAEFGEGDPLPTHAWFIGFHGDLALGLVIEDGGVGGRDAAPVAGEIFAAFGDG